MGDAMADVGHAPGWAGWQWQPDDSAWFAGVGTRAQRWSPPPVLGLSVTALRAELGEAASRHDRWLVHPCVSTLLQGNGMPLEAHARLAAWAAQHLDDRRLSRLGNICLSKGTWLWTQDGPQWLDAGAHELPNLQTASELIDVLATPDPWGDSLPDIVMAGDIGDAGWWSRLPLSDSDESELAADIRSLLSTQRLLHSLLPAASAWLGAVTRVVVPLVRSQGAEFRCGSIAGIPGLVFVEMTHKQLLVLEALVHESAHLHFHIAEFDNDFITATHDGRYASPLRPEPRPLRGIFLAFHALLYMCAFYKDWQHCTGDAAATEARQDLLRHRDAASETLRGARAHLSAAGDAFLTTCVELAAADDLR